MDQSLSFGNFRHVRKVHLYNLAKCDNIRAPIGARESAGGFVVSKDSVVVQLCYTGQLLYCTQMVGRGRCLEYEMRHLHNSGILPRCA